MHEDSYDYLVKRISNLNRESIRLFGTMRVEQMICHLSDQLRLTLNQESIPY